MMHGQKNIKLHINIYSRIPLIPTLVMRIGLVLRENLPIIVQNCPALKLTVIVSSTVQCYGF